MLTHWPLEVGLRCSERTKLGSIDGVERNGNAMDTRTNLVCLELNEKVSEKLDGISKIGFRDRTKRRASLPVGPGGNARRPSTASACSTSCKNPFAHFYTWTKWAEILKKKTFVLLTFAWITGNLHAKTRLATALATDFGYKDLARC